MWLALGKSVAGPRDPTRLARLSRQLTVEARDGPAITSFGLLAVLNVGFKDVGARHAVPEGAERRAPPSLATAAACLRSFFLFWLFLEMGRVRGRFGSQS